MMTRHFPFWPKRLAKSLTVPKTDLFYNLEVSARRYPDKIAVHYYGASLTYKRLMEETEALAGYLQQRLGVSKGERVLLYMQNSPQFIIAYYAILRANAVVVPINPMNLTEEVAFPIEDCEIRVALASQELYERIVPLKQHTSLEHIIVATYSDYISPDFTWAIPEVVKAPRQPLADADCTHWQEAVKAGLKPGPVTVQAEDISVLPYTSGTTGKPKGCIHTHETVQANLVGAALWSNITSDAVVLTTLPLFHVTGMEHSMNAPIFSGSTMVVMTRWNSDLAGELIQRHRCTHWTVISTMLVDFLSNSNLSRYDLQSLTSIGGGGAALPQAIGEKLYALTGVRFVEGYGLSETIAQTHFNPPDRPKMQCLGIPSFNTDARIIHPETLQELGPGEEGEIIVHGPQVFKGYWKRPQETEKAFLTLDGKVFFRTGDIGKYDEEGYFFIVDRLKRMINASGFKVWPTEVESILYKHPAVQQACVIGVPDERRGETVKAYIVLHEKERGRVKEEEIIAWAKGQMAAYKYPRIVQFVEQLPVSGSGKILWRKLQEEEWAKWKNA
jgi:fatty-acyl-CoA synthase